jgi:ABC-type Mn2+/Zn2+ transport system ATPase subunit
MSHLKNAQVAVSVKDTVLRYPGSSNIALEIQVLEFNKGSKTALVGPNGAGKSTLLKAIVGLLPTPGGQISVLGQPAGRNPRSVAYVPQRREVDWRFPITVFDVALMGRDVHLHWPRRPSRSDRELAFQALETVKMTDQADSHIADLSGGQQQRVFLARALAQHAELLLLDEPFVGVDAVTEEIILHVMDVLAHQGCTMVVATHDLTTLTEHYDSAVFLCHTVIASGAIRDILTPDLLAKTYGSSLALLNEEYPHGLDF